MNSAHEKEKGYEISRIVRNDTQGASNRETNLSDVYVDVLMCCEYAIAWTAEWVGWVRTLCFISVSVLLAAKGIEKKNREVDRTHAHTTHTYTFVRLNCFRFAQSTRANRPTHNGTTESKGFERQRLHMYLQVHAWNVYLCVVYPWNIRYNVTGHKTRLRVFWWSPGQQRLRSLTS